MAVRNSEMGVQFESLPQLLLGSFHFSLRQQPRSAFKVTLAGPRVLRSRPGGKSSQANQEGPEKCIPKMTH